MSGAVRAGARAPYEAHAEWLTASEVRAWAPADVDPAEVRAVMDLAARAEGREVAVTYPRGRWLVGWCPLVAGRDPERLVALGWPVGVAA